LSAPVHPGRCVRVPLHLGTPTWNTQRYQLQLAQFGLIRDPTDTLLKVVSVARPKSLTFRFPTANKISVGVVLVDGDSPPGAIICAWRGRGSRRRLSLRHVLAEKWPADKAGQDGAEEMPARVFARFHGRGLHTLKELESKNSTDGDKPGTEVLSNPGTTKSRVNPVFGDCLARFHTASFSGFRGFPQKLFAENAESRVRSSHNNELFPEAISEAMT